MARGRGGGVSAGPWSARTPVRVVQTGFYGAAGGRSRLRDWRGPTYRVTERLDPRTAGGRLAVTIRRTDRRGGRPIRLHTRIRRGGRVSLRFRPPPLGRDFSAFFSARFAFAGTRLVAPRRPFYEFSLALQRTPAGHVEAQFPVPCAPRRC